MQLATPGHGPARPAGARRAWLWLLAVVLLVVAVGGAGAVALRRAGDDPAAGAAAAPRPVVVQNRLVDARTGREFVPRGVTWSSFEYACTQGWGLSALDLVRGVDPATREATAIAGWGATTVRVPLNQDCWLGTRGAPVGDALDERTAQDYRHAVEGFVDALGSSGLVTILDLHSRKRVGTDEYSRLAMPDAESLVFWSSVAATFRDHPAVLFEAFDADTPSAGAGRQVPEPGWACWRDGGCAVPLEETATGDALTFPAQGMARVVRAIRDAGAPQPILLPGVDGGTDLTRWRELAPDDDQLVAAFHQHSTGSCSTPRCWDSVVAPLAEHVPVVTTDLRPTDERDLSAYLAWAERHHVGALFWVWAAHDDDPLSLIRGSERTPTAFGRRVRSFLTGSPQKPWSEQGS